MANRMERANAEIQKALSQIILTELSDPRFSSLITVTGVKTTPDFKYCKVNVSVFSQNEQERKDCLALLKKSGSYIRTLLCRVVRMPSAPKIEFLLDEGYIHTERINQILENLEIPALDDEE